MMKIVVHKQGNSNAEQPESPARRRRPHETNRVRDSRPMIDVMQL